MGSYVLFARSSTGSAARDLWIGSSGANAQPGATPGSVAPASAFNADTATGAATALAGGAAADYASDGVLMNAKLAMFDLSEAPSGTFDTAAPTVLQGLLGAGSPLFAAANTRLDPSHGGIVLDPGVPIVTIDLAQRDADWNGIKNLELRLDQDASARDIRIENFVDVRLQFGDDPCLIDLGNLLPEPLAVELRGVKRGEVDLSLAPAPLDLSLGMWSNSSDGQNSFDIRGSVRADHVEVFGDVVAGSMFGNKAGQPGYDAAGVYDGRFTTLFANLGAGDDRYEAADAFRAVDRVWGGTGDDVLRASGGNDFLFGDNGSGTNLNADPSDVANVQWNFIEERVGSGAVPDFNGGLGPVNHGPLIDLGPYTITATGGDLIQLRTGAPGQQAGGLGIRSTDDAGDLLADSEIDGRGTPEAITIDFKDGADRVELELTALYTESFTLPEGFPASDDERVVYEVFLSDGTSFTDSASRGGPNAAPGLVTIVIDQSNAGGPLIDAIRLTAFTRPQDGNFISDFYLSAVRACVIAPGEAGDDLLAGGSGADWLEGNGDGGAFQFLPDGRLRIEDGDRLVLADTAGAAADLQRDIVNFNDGDGVDTVTFFDTARDRLRVEGNEAVTKLVIVDETSGIGTLVRHGADGDAIFLVGVVDTGAIGIVTF